MNESDVNLDNELDDKLDNELDDELVEPITLIANKVKFQFNEDMKLIKMVEVQKACQVSENSEAKKMGDFKSVIVKFRFAAGVSFDTIIKNAIDRPLRIAQAAMRNKWSSVGNMGTWIHTINEPGHKTPKVDDWLLKVTKHQCNLSDVPIEIQDDVKQELKLMLENLAELNDLI